MCYSILVGNVVRFFLTFFDEDKLPADPTAVACRVGQDGDTAIPLTVVKDGIGSYHADWDTTLALAGDYFCEAIGSGAITATREIAVTLRAPRLV